ncbi:hypothetical protein N0V82_005149 [Gnomoniopsis sp. IMI 355080]|nr:hypothetical protein N0V82_005149 [Gnomoniopsis sp. IMI 355080]
MPISFNFAAIVGPLVGGQLADLSTRFPGTYSHSWFLQRWPYAPPAIANGIIIFVALLLVFFGLEEGSADSASYQIVSAKSPDEEELHLMTDYDSHKSSTDLAEGRIRVEETKSNVPILPFRRIFTTNMLLALLAYSLQEAHVSSYNTLWAMFMSEPVGKPSDVDLPFRFSGGAGMPPDELAWSVSMVGIVGLFVLFVIYPRINQRLGTLEMWRIFLVGFPLAYFAVPYIAVVPSTVPPVEGKKGPAVWTLIFMLQFALVLISSCVIPSQLVLTNL